MKKIKIVTICFFSIFSSCQKENVLTNILGDSNSVNNFKSEVSDYDKDGYGLFLKDTHGGIHFMANKQYSNQDHIDWLATAFFCKNLWGSYPSRKRIYENAGNVRINSLNIPMGERNIYGILRDVTENTASTLRSFFGTTVKITLDGSASSGYAKQSVPLYIPKELNLKFTDGGVKLERRPVIKRGSVLNLKWDADPLNTKGVIVTVENADKVDAKGNPDRTVIPKRVRNVSILADDGDYTFTADDFNGIPDNTELLIVVIRANIILAANGNYKMQVYGGEEVFVNQYLLMP